MSRLLEKHSLLSIAAVALLALSVGACNKKKAGEQVGGTTIQIDGSSTVFPITQAVAEEFQLEKGGQVTVGVSGTGGGFKKFCRGQLAVTGASRPIRASEIQQCKQAGVEFIELPIAYDGIAVVVHPSNDWVDFMTVAELKKLWEPKAQGTVTKWSQVREGWPDDEIHLFGAGVDSGTYDYFTEAVVGEEHSSRGDFTSSEDDNVLVQGISTDPKALGFFGYAYYAENEDKLKLVPIDGGKGPVKPSPETIADGSYQPLSRPLFVYVSVKATERPEVVAFVDYLLESGGELVGEVGYVPLPDESYELVAERFAKRTTGTLFSDGAQVGVTVEELLSGK